MRTEGRSFQGRSDVKMRIQALVELILKKKGGGSKGFFTYLFKSNQLLVNNYSFKLI